MLYLENEFVASPWQELALFWTRIFRTVIPFEVN